MILINVNCILIWEQNKTLDVKLTFDTGWSSSLAMK